MRKRTPEQIERAEGKRMWRAEQARLTRDMRESLRHYDEFRERGFEDWFKEWRVRRRVR